MSGHIFSAVELEWVMKVFSARGWDLSEYTANPPELHGAEPYAAAAQALTARLNAIALHPEATATEKLPIETVIGKLRVAILAIKSNDEVKPAAEHVAKVESAAVGLSAAVDTRIKRQAGLRAKVLGAKLGPSLTPQQMRALNSEKKDLLAQIDKADTTIALDGLDAPVDAHVKTLTEANALAVHEKAAREALAVARADFKARAGALPPINFKLILNGLEDAATALKSATSAKEYQAAEQKAKDAVASLKAAADFNTKLDKWRADTQPYAYFGSAAADRDALKKLYHQLLDEAVAAAGKGDFGAAEAALAKFTKGANVDSGKMKEAAAYAAELSDFKANHIKRMERVIDTGFNTSDTLKTDFTEAKKPAGTGDFNEAIKRLRDLIARIDKLEPLVDKIKRYASQRKSKSKDVDFIKAAFDAMDLELAKPSPDIDVAIAALSFAPDKIDKVDCVMDMSALADEVGELKKLLSLEMVDYFTSETKKVRKMVRGSKGGNTGAARTALTDLKDEIDKAKGLAAAYGAVREQRARFPDPALGAKYLGPIQADCTAGKYDDARLKVPSVLAEYAILEEYFALNAEVEKLEASFTSLGDTTYPPLLAKARAEARALIDPGLKTSEARDRLGKELAKDGIAGLLTDFRIYVGYEKRVSKLLDQTRSLMQVKEPIDAVTLQSTKAKDLAEKDGKFFEATRELEALEALLGRVKPYAAARMQARSVLAALKSVVAKDPSLKPKVLSDSDAGAFDTRMATADAKAVKLEFKEAQADFEGIVKGLGAASRACSTALEAGDAAINPRAGHSIARHGPDVKDDELKHRLLTGVAPDKVTSPTNMSSAFESPEDWLASRERAMELARTTGVDGKDLLVEPTGSPPGLPVSTKVFEYKQIVDHGKPIDKAFLGRKPAVQATADGGIGSNGCYETFRETEGITKSFTLIQFEFTPPDANGEVKDKRDYIERYKAANGDTMPPDLKGQWMVMQHFPYCEDWDPDTNTHTT